MAPDIYLEGFGRAALAGWNETKFTWSRFFLEAFIAILLILSAFLPPF